MIMLMVKLEVYIETCSWLGLTCDRLNKKLHNVLECTGMDDSNGYGNLKCTPMLKVFGQFL